MRTMRGPVDQVRTMHDQDDAITQTREPHHSLDAEQSATSKPSGAGNVQMIASGAHRTGLFLGSASRLHNTGPALLFSYAFVGVIAFFLMRALGELVLPPADVGAFVSYMREFYGESGPTSPGGCIG